MKESWQKLVGDWQPPDGFLRIKSIDMHTAGEPLRIIISGLPAIAGNTMLEKRSYMRQHSDRFRKLLMLEPRGHADMYGCLVTEPENDDSDFGVLFLHNEGYSSMCGHAIIALTRMAVEMGWVTSEQQPTEVQIDTPAGQVKSWARMVDGQAVEVHFDNVPSFVVCHDRPIETQTLGKTTFTLAFGGAYYAYVDVDSLPLTLDPQNIDAIIRAGREIKQTVSELDLIQHPFDGQLSFLYGTIFVSRPRDPLNHSRNVCVFADGEVDRSPTGTGVSGRAAIHFAKGEMAKGQSISIESILGTKFSVQVRDSVRFGKFDAVIPTVSGEAYVTGRHEFLLDPQDALAEGFMLR